MNIAIVHMSGGDVSGSIDDSVRNAISKLSHFHLTSSSASTAQLIALGETSERIVEVGEPALDLLRTMPIVPLETLAMELNLPNDAPFVIATLHPVTDEAEGAGEQMQTMLEALAEFGLVSVVTYPNSDAGGRAMRAVLESWRNQPFLRIVPSLGSHRYLSLMRHAAALVGNSSSGIIEAPSLKVPVVNIGSRQTGRLRADNVTDVPCRRDEIVNALRFVLQDTSFRRRLAACRNPYGDGHTSERVVDTLTRLKLGPALTAKWLPRSGSFLTDAPNGV
jgi:UDP-N-acetylglucosamine 2-epimerase (non-hydrolysing)/GDP/UDP-N,N'-diacetylbacillosamine 2-epimerase (hydrolysing)